MVVLHNCIVAVGLDTTFTGYPVPVVDVRYPASNLFRGMYYAKYYSGEKSRFKGKNEERERKKRKLHKNGLVKNSPKIKIISKRGRDDLNAQYIPLNISIFNTEKEI